MTACDFPDLHGTPITLGAFIIADGYLDEPAEVVGFHDEDADERAAVSVRWPDGSEERIERDPLQGPWDGVAFSEIVVQTSVVA